VTVRQILTNKGTGVYGTSPDTSLRAALKEMAFRNVGSLLVLRDGKLVGILTERGCLRTLARLEEGDPLDLPVQRFMEPVEATVAPDQEIWEAMTLMTQKRVRHLPVVEGGHLVGLISIGDVVYSLLNHQSVQIQELLNYIQGNP